MIQTARCQFTDDTVGVAVIGRDLESVDDNGILARVRSCAVGTGTRRLQREGEREEEKAMEERGEEGKVGVV